MYRLPLKKSHRVNAVCPDALPVTGNRARVTCFGLVLCHVVANVLAAAKEVGSVLVPADARVDPLRPNAGPGGGDGARITGIDMIESDVVTHILVRVGEVSLPVGPIDYGIDLIGLRQTRPVAGDRTWIPRIGAVGRHIVT